jgi:hypothetical protein
MEFFQQSLDDLVESLSSLRVEWKDDIATRVIERVEHLPIKDTYTEADIHALLADKFDDGWLICRLFLGLSKDALTALLHDALGKGGQGVTRYKKEPDVYINTLVRLGLLEAMNEQTNREPKWSDILVERLRSGRGSAISGQRRGRGLEDHVESIIRKVFGDAYEARCQFVGKRNVVAKCDFAVPSKDSPRILVEAKAYGATGSKMTDVIGDIDAIVEAKRHDTALLFFTDGLTWKQRQSDLKKLVERQNNGEVARIYTTSMSGQFEDDLMTLKVESKL